MSGEAEIAEVTHDLFFSNNLISGSNTPETDCECVCVCNEHAGYLSCCSVYVRVRMLSIIHSSMLATAKCTAMTWGLKRKKPAGVGTGIKLK